MSEPRYTRQVRLAEVGERGQARIAEGGALVIASRGLAGVVAARYAAGAGFRALQVTSEAAVKAAREVDARVQVDVAAVNEPLGRSPAGPPEALAPAWLEEMDPATRAVAQGSCEVLLAIRRRLEGET
jgi:hypothetical protein